VPVGNLITEATGTWSTVLFTVAAMDIIAAVCALVVLKPVLRRHQTRSR
jgi:HAMP domain-containing protein